MNAIYSRTLSHGYVLGLTGSLLKKAEGQDLDLIGLPANADAHNPVLVANDIALILHITEFILFDESLPDLPDVRGFVFAIEGDRLVDLTLMRCGDGA